MNTNSDSMRPKSWPADWEWPPTLSDEDVLRAVAEGVPGTPEDIAAEELRKQREASLVLPDDPYADCESIEDCCLVLFDVDPAMQKFFGKSKPDC